MTDTMVHSGISLLPDIRQLVHMYLVGDFEDLIINARATTLPDTCTTCWIDLKISAHFLLCSAGMIRHYFMPSSSPIYHFMATNSISAKVASYYSRLDDSLLIYTCFAHFRSDLMILMIYSTVISRTFISIANFRRKLTPLP